MADNNVNQNEKTPTLEELAHVRASLQAQKKLVQQQLAALEKIAETLKK